MLHKVQAAKLKAFNLFFFFPFFFTSRMGSPNLSFLLVGFIMEEECYLLPFNVSFQRMEINLPNSEMPLTTPLIIEGLHAVL